jgi:hypothetical protein
MRQQLVARPTHVETQTKKRVASAGIDNDKPTNETDFKKVEIYEESSNCLIFHSTYEKRLEDTLRDIHQVW